MSHEHHSLCSRLHRSIEGDREWRCVLPQHHKGACRPPPGVEDVATLAELRERLLVAETERANAVERAQNLERQYHLLEAHCKELAEELQRREPVTLPAGTVITILEPGVAPVVDPIPAEEIRT